MVFMSFGRHPSCSKHFTWVRTCWQCFKIHLYYSSLQLLNGTSSITDRHYFSMRRVKIQRVTHCVAFKSLVPTNATSQRIFKGKLLSALGREGIELCGSGSNLVPHNIGNKSSLDGNEMNSQHEGIIM